MDIKQAKNLHNLYIQSLEVQRESVASWKKLNRENPDNAFYPQAWLLACSHEQEIIADIDELEEEFPLLTEEDDEDGSWWDDRDDALAAMHKPSVR